MRVTPENITELQHGEIFVFGSNEAGRHGAGAANHAYVKFGAEMGCGFGHTGRTFAIPTKDWYIDTLPLEVIQFYVKRFYDYAIYNPRYQFLITEIGCGLAGYKPEQIAPMFKHFRKLKNVSLPQRFIDVLDGTFKEREEVAKQIFLKLENDYGTNLDTGGNEKGDIFGHTK